MTRIAIAIAAVVAAAAPALADPLIDAAEPEQYADGVRAMIDGEAREALGAGNLDRAWDLFAWLVRLDPNDARALRELGRVAAAKGALVEADRALARCLALRGDSPDPEAHFIRGEVLLALDRRDEAMRELDRAEAELPYVQSHRTATIWRARIYTLRKRHAEAAGLLQSILPETPAEDGYGEIALLLGEAHILADEHQKAVDLLRHYLRFGANKRAEELLAWALAVRESHERELVLREHIVRRSTTSSDVTTGAGAAALADLGRALERAARPDVALGTYREARDHGSEDLDEDIERLDGLLSPEVLVSGEVGDYPTGRIAGGTAEAMVPVNRALRLVAITEHRRLIEGGEQTMSAASVWGQITLPSRHQIAAGATAWQDASEDYRPSASAIFRSDPTRWLSAYARGEVNAPWLESATALREGGSTTGAELQLYARLGTPKLILVGAGRSRRLGLIGWRGDDEVSATQHYSAVGLDWVVHADHSSVARGHSLLPGMLLPAGLASSVVLSFRHAEVWSDGDLGPRLFLVPRSRIEELSATARTVVDDSGILALGATGGLGYDPIRGARLWRAGGEMMLSLTPMLRLTSRAEVASETTSGLTGRRIIGFVGLNADL
jgi:tetratricopeptide (TPR) repeat protein